MYWNDPPVRIAARLGVTIRTGGFFQYINTESSVSILYIFNIYYSNFDKHKCTYFHWAKCNEPTTLTLGNLRCFSLISTKGERRWKYERGVFRDIAVTNRYTSGEYSGILPLQTGFNRIVKGWNVFPKNKL